MGSVLAQWEADQKGRLGRWWSERGEKIARYARVVLIMAFGFAVGVHFAAMPAVEANSPTVRNLNARLAAARDALTARAGELTLSNMEVVRLQTIMQHSARFRIPADLATNIYDTAIEEGIDPRIAFRLVRVESGFEKYAVSSRGAVGLTQIMPRTAYILDPSLHYRDLFERQVNLHLGFRYLRAMLKKYNGDWRLALLAYNRGPGTVDSIRSGGGDPANGYARAVLHGVRLRSSQH